MKVIFKQFDYKQDAEWIYNIYSNKKESSSFVSDFYFSTREEFEKKFMSNIINNYFYFNLLVDDSGERMGLIYAHDYKQESGHIKFTAYIIPQYRQLGVGALASLRFVHMLFSTLSINKVYVTVFEGNQISLKNNLQAGFHREATLKDYVFLNGGYRDLIYLSISRKQFYKRYKGNPIFNENSF